jgi:hypothetical protein
MISLTVRLYNPNGPDRAAAVSVESAYKLDGQFLIRLARGQKMGNLTSGTVYGPYPESELVARFD